MTNTTPNMFLTPEEVSTLTGFRGKSKQVSALQKMGIPFFVNPNGRAIVSRAVIEGTIQAAAAVKPRAGWKSNMTK